MDLKTLLQKNKNRKETIMKNSKLTKILILTLTAALIACCAFAFGASAEGEAQTLEIEIAGRNVKFGATLSIRYAVLASSVTENATLEVYKGDPSNADNFWFSVKADEELCNDTVNGMEGPFYTYTVPGFAAADVCNEVYVFVKDGDNVSETMKYSPAEYFYERLFVDDVINPDDETETYQKALYLSYLEHAADSQAYWINFRQGKDVTLVTDRHFVNIAGGISGVYEPGYELTLGEISTLPGWHVTTYTLNDDGIATSTTAYKTAGSTITLAAGTTATLIEEGKYVGEYFAQYGGLDYNNATNIASVGAINRDAGGYTILDSLTTNAGNNNRQWLLIKDMSTDAATNKVLQFSTQSGTGPKLGNKPYVTFDITGDNTSGNYFVFETDIMICERAASTGYILFNLLNVSAEGRPSSVNEVEALATYLAYINIKEGSDGTVNGYIGTQGSYSGPAITLDEWHNIRMEVSLSGVVYWYVDGEYYSSKTVKSGGFGAEDFATVANRIGMLYSEGGLSNTTVYFDNTFVGIVNK